MSIAISEDHRALADTASDFLRRKDARAGARALLTAGSESLPSWWGDLAELGWLGLHLPEAHGGSGYSLEELVVVVEELGRAVAPGPFESKMMKETHLHFGKTSIINKNKKHETRYYPTN